MNEQQNNIQNAICPSCGEPAVATQSEAIKFPYSNGTEQTELEANVRVHTCANCGLRYLDDSAEEEKHNAVCDHLGVLRASEIRELRHKLGMSRLELSQLTKLGEATIGRWERGELIQNAANDQFLYLLGYPDNVERLRRRARAREHAALTGHSGDMSDKGAGRFRALVEPREIEKAHNRASAFRIHVEVAEGYVEAA